MEGAILGVIKAAINEWGVKIIVEVLLLAAIWYLYKELKALSVKHEALQNARIAEVRELVQVIEANADALERLSDIIRARDR